VSDDATSAQVISGEAAPGLSDRASALAAWARQVVANPNATTPAHIARLREVGLGDREIFEATAFIAFRLAFSTVNGALGVQPDRQLADAAPPLVRSAVSYGRAPALTPS
jgi:alkylhydroperoxidase family enzyme